MEKMYSDTLKAGFKFGIIIAVIYAIVGLAGIIINHTPGMVSYMDQLKQYDQQMFNQSYYPNNGVPYVHSHPMPRPPPEYYLTAILSVLMFAVLIIGFIAVGAYALRKYGQQKYSLKSAAYMGAFAGLGSLIPIAVVMILANIINLIVNGNYMTSLFNVMPPMAASILPYMVACELICCCLPIGILVPLFLSSIGAIGYVLATGKLESRSAPA